MSQRVGSFLVVILLGPGAVGVATLALWENEGRFDYHRAAVETRVVDVPVEAGEGESISYTDALDRSTPIDGLYVEAFFGYLRVRRYAEIYSWSEMEDDDGFTYYSSGWYSSVEPNSENSGVHQSLSSDLMTPRTYRLGALEVLGSGIHFADPYTEISPSELVLSDYGRDYDLVAENDGFYIRQVPGETTIGDERVQYIGIPAADTATYFGAVEDAVAVGRQFELEETFVSPLIRNDGMLHHLVNGPRDEALASVRFDFRLTKWLARVIGTVVMVIGFWLLFARFASVLYVFRWLRPIVDVGVFLLGLAVGIPFALLVIAAGMVLHAPLVALVPMVLALGGCGFLIHRSGVVAKVARARRDGRLARRRAKRREERRKQEDELAGLDPEEREARLLEMEVEETFRSLAAIGHAEGGLDNREQRFLRRWGRRNGVARARMDLLIKEAKGEPVAADREDLALLVDMALADGVVSARELGTLNAVGRRLGVSETELKRMVAEAESVMVPEEGLIA